MQWEALPEHRRDLIDFHEAGSPAWIGSRISGITTVLPPYFRTGGNICERGVSQVTLRTKAQIVSFDPRQQYTPFNVQAERVNLVFRVKKKDVLF